jgi:hypothetical protein
MTMNTLRTAVCAMLVFAGTANILAQAPPQNNEAPRVKEKIRVTGGEKTDFIFTRTFMVGQADSLVPFGVSRSGAYTVGVGYGIPIGKVLELKLEPRATWHKIYFKPSPDKWFPSALNDSSLVYEKQRIFYLEMPIGLKFKLARNAVEKYQVLLEGGFSAGVNFGGALRTRINVDTNSDGIFDGRVTSKLTRVGEWNRFRFGPYARFGLRYVSIYGFYRMTSLYRVGKRFNETSTTTRDYPNFPKLEIGISVTI